MKFFKKLRLCFYYFKNSWSRVDYEAEYYLKDPTDNDKAMLALGRWEYFKQIEVPSFTVGLDSDSECLLSLYATSQIIGKPGPLNGEQSLLRTSIMIKTIQDCQSKGKRISDYVQTL